MLIMRSNSSPATIPSLSASATWKHFQWNQYICLKASDPEFWASLHMWKLVLLNLVDGGREGSAVLLVVSHGKGEPLIEGDGPVVVVINLGKEFLWLLAPPAESKLVGNQISRLDHGGELFHGNLAIVINIGFGEGSEEDVVELDVRVALCALHRSLHEHDKFILVFDIHGAKGDLTCRFTRLRRDPGQKSPC